MMACGLWGSDHSPAWYAAREAERRRWLRHYRALGCTARKAETLADRRLRR